MDDEIKEDQDLLPSSPQFKAVQDKKHVSIQKFDDDMLPEDVRGKEFQAVAKGKQLEQFAPVEEPKPVVRNQPQVLDLIDEADESDENDEDLVIEAMIGEYLRE